ncbi:hypothetical protein D9M71_576440 [compost metagenome]
MQFIGQPPGHHLFAIKQLVGQQQAGRTGVAEQTRQQQAGTKLRAHTQWRERDAQLGRTADQHLVAMQQQGGADADRRATDGSNQRLFQAHDHPHQAEHRAVQVAGWVVEEVAKVVASAEAVRPTGDDDGIDSGVFTCRQQQVAQQLVHGSVQGIELVGAVEGQGQQALVQFACDQVVHGSRFCCCEGALPGSGA